MRSGRRVAMFPALAGPAAFAVAARIAGGRVAGYSRRDEPISALAAHGSPPAAVMVSGFLGLAGATAALGRTLRGTPAAPPPVPSLLMAAAATTAGAGLARCSDRTCPTRFLGDDSATVTRSDDLHALCSAATFALWTSIPLVAARRATGASAAYRASSRRLGLLTLALLVIGGQLARRPSKRWSGTAQRAMLAAALAWFPVAARQPA